MLTTAKAWKENGSCCVPAGQRNTKGWGNCEMSVMADKVYAKERIVGRNDTNLGFVGSFERFQAARNGPATINPIQRASSRCVGLSAPSIFNSIPKRICQIMSPTPPTAKPIMPTSDNPYPSGKALRHEYPFNRFLMSAPK